MEKIDKLLEISTSLNLEDVKQRLLSIKRNYELPYAKLTLPLVGEFSSGKTTLINALTDSKKLETATTPTTAALYRIHFGSEKFSAKVWDENGEQKEILDEEGLSNEALKDASWVDVYDTSTKLPSSIVLIDTPGLSSPIPRHRETLMKILPEADGVLLVSDINQQLTRSLSNFIETSELIKCPIFLVLTKSDTKSSEDIDSVKKYIKENNLSQIKRVIAVSAKNNDLDELYNLFDEIEKEKSAILKQVNEHRVKTIAKQLISYIDELLKASNSDEGFEDAIKKQKNELRKLERNINKLIDSTIDSLKDIEKTTYRDFEDRIFERLDEIVSTRSKNIDYEVYSTINIIADLFFDNYISEVDDVLCSIARKRLNTDDEISLRSLQDLDLSNIDAPNMTYDLELNTVGHENDKRIAQFLDLALTFGGMVYSKANTAAKVITKKGSKEIVKKGANKGVRTYLNKKTLIEAAEETIKIKTLGELGQATNSKQSESKEDDQNNGGLDKIIKKTVEFIKPGGGILEDIVGGATDVVIAKPKRKRLIRNYIDDVLAPKFKQDLIRIRKELTSLIGEALYIEAKGTINQKTSMLEKLQQDSKEERESFENEMRLLQEYKKELITL